MHTIRNWLFAAVIAALARAPAGAVGVPVSGFAVPYTSYTYDYWGQPAPAPHAYLPSTVIRGWDLGVGPLRNPNDLHVSDAGNIYIADTGNNRVIVLDPEWNLIRVVDSFERDG